MTDLPKVSVGDVGAVFTLDITEDDVDGVPQATDFIPGTDTVTFVFRHSDGQTTSGVGAFTAGGTAEYTTIAGDILAVGNLEIQLHIVSASWTGVSDIFCTKVGEKIADPNA